MCVKIRSVYTGARSPSAHGMECAQGEVLDGVHKHTHNQNPIKGRTIPSKGEACFKFESGSLEVQVSLHRSKVTLCTGHGVCAGRSA